jgi:hypothetical protein
MLERQPPRQMSHSVRIQHSSLSNLTYRFTPSQEKRPSYLFGFKHMENTEEMADTRVLLLDLAQCDVLLVLTSSPHGILDLFASQILAARQILNLTM